MLSVKILSLSFSGDTSSQYCKNNYVYVELLCSACRKKLKAFRAWGSTQFNNLETDFITN